MLSRLIPVRQFAETEWVDDTNKWIQLYPYDSWDHPVYGSTTIDKSRATQFKTNFDKRVKDPHVFTDYEHGLDQAKGNKASGELVEVDVRDDGLWGLVKFTAAAKKEIEDGEWNYWSTSHYDTWTHPQTKETFDWVLDGGGLTNKPWVKGMLPLNFSEVMVENPEFVKAEVAPEEHQDHGVGVDPRVNLDDSYPNRIDTPPPGEDGSIPDRPVTGGENEGRVMTTEEILTALREKLGLPEDADIVTHVSGMNDELEPLRQLKKENSEKKQFAEAYPNEFARLQKLEQDNRENFALSFSEKLAARRFSRATAEKDDEGNVVNESTTIGLSARAVEDITGLVKKFGENSATLEDFSGVLDSILDSGIVDYGNRGSELAPPPESVVVEPKNPLEGRKLFAEKVNEIVEADELTFDAALLEAAKRYPSLYESWATPVHS